MRGRKNTPDVGSTLTSGVIGKEGYRLIIACLATYQA